MTTDESTKLHRTTYRVLTLLSILSKYEDGLTFTELSAWRTSPKERYRPCSIRWSI